MRLADCGVVTAAASDDIKMDETEDRTPAAVVALCLGRSRGWMRCLGVRDCCLSGDRQEQARHPGFWLSEVDFSSSGVIPKTPKPAGDLLGSRENKLFSLLSPHVFSPTRDPVCDPTCHIVISKWA